MPPSKQRLIASFGFGRTRVASVLICGVLCLVTMLGCQPQSADSPVESGSPNGVDRSAVRGSELASVSFERSVAIDSLDIVYQTGEQSGFYSIVESLGGGVGVLDYDGDGLLDLVFPGGGEISETGLTGLPTRLLRQVGDDEFVDVAIEAGIAEAAHYTHGVACGDYDNNGFTDIVLTGYGGLQLWHNNGDGSFRDVTHAAGLDDDQWSTTAAWGDLNGDGALDLYVTHYVDWSLQNNPECLAVGGVRDVCPPVQFNGVTDVVYLSNRDGTFTRQVEQIGLVPEGKGLGVLLADWDGDRDLDIYVANDTVPNFFYVNQGDGTFVEQALIAGLAMDDMANPNGSMGLATGQFCGDARPDIFVTNYEQELSALYENLGDGNFVYESRQQGLNRLGLRFVGFGCVTGDFNLDGRDDVAIANGHAVRAPASGEVKQLPLLLLNSEAGFQRADLTAESYFGTPHLGRGLAAADMNRDGQLDLIFANSMEPAVLLYGRAENDAKTCIIQLVGQNSNRDGIGATITVRTAESETQKMVTSGMGYLSSSPNEVMFVLPAGQDITDVEVNWPSGIDSVTIGAQLQDTADGGGVPIYQIVEPDSTN